MKSTIKEVVIILLVLVSVVLIFAFVLYDYNPEIKTIPKAVEEYKLQPEVAEELEKSVEVETKNIIKTYTVDEKDLNAYETSNAYDRGKINPFRISAVTTAVDGTNETTGLLNGTNK